MICSPRALYTEYVVPERSQNLLTFVKTASLARLTQVKIRLNSRVYQSPDLLLTVLNA